jgi:hypothetical protein
MIVPLPPMFTPRRSPLLLSVNEEKGIEAGTLLINCGIRAELVIVLVLPFVADFISVAITSILQILSLDFITLTHKTEKIATQTRMVS